MVWAGPFGASGGGGCSDVPGFWNGVVGAAVGADLFGGGDKAGGVVDTGDVVAGFAEFEGGATSSAAEVESCVTWGVGKMADGAGGEVEPVDRA